MLVTSHVPASESDFFALHRYETALKDEAYKLIESRVLLETLPENFKAVLRAGTVSTNVYAQS